MPGKISFPKLLPFAGVAASAALAAAFYGTSQPGGEAPPRAPASTQAAETGTRLYQPEAGARYVYGFRRKISFQGDLGGAPLQPVAFGGELYVDVLRADERGFEAVVSERVEGAPAPRAPFARITAGARGDTLGFFRADGLNDEESQHVQIVKDLVSLWLFPLRADTVGEFEARFEPLTAEPGLAREKKTKLSYRAHAANTPEILASEHYLVWDLTLRLPKEVKGAETTRLGHDKTSLAAESRYQLLFRAREKAPAYSRSLLAALALAEPLAIDTSKAPSLADHPDYRNLDWGKILADLKDSARLSPREQLNVFGDALKFLRLHPDRVADVAALLRDPSLLGAGADSPVFRTAVGTLASFGSPAAFAALREACDSPQLGAPGKETILAALTTTQAPIDAETRDYLRAKLDGEQNPRLAQGAAYALGSALQSAPNDAGSLEAITDLQKRFAAATTLPDRLALLDAMGNSGRSEFLPTLEGVLAGDAPSTLKAKAEFALRFIHTPAATQDLLKGLGASDASVRESAAGAMGAGDWNESFRAPLEACASGDAVTRVRSACESSLASHPRVADAQ